MGLNLQPFSSNGDSHQIAENIKKKIEQMTRNKFDLFVDEAKKTRRPWATLLTVVTLANM
jgi:hypothetical protein